MISSQFPSRRDVLKSGAISTAALGATRTLLAAQPGPELLRDPAPDAPAPDPFRGLRAGVASYSLRGLALDAVIKGINRVDLKYVSIKNVDQHLGPGAPPERRKQVAKQFRDAGITPLSCG